MTRWKLLLLVAGASTLLNACAVVAIVDATATVVSTGVSVTAKTVGAVADVVIPDDDDDDETPSADD